MDTLCAEMITYILQYLPGDKILYLYDNMRFFQEAICDSDHNMQARIYIECNDRIDELWKNQFILCISEYESLCVEESLYLHNTRIVIDEYYNKIPDGISGLEFEDVTDLMSFVDEGKPINCPANPDANLLLHEKSNYRVDGKKSYDNILIYRVDHITVDAKIRDKVGIDGSHDIVFSQNHINYVQLYGYYDFVYHDVFNCHFNNIYECHICDYGGDGHVYNCSFGIIHHLHCSYLDILRENKFKLIRNFHYLNSFDAKICIEDKDFIQNIHIKMHCQFEEQNVRVIIKNCAILESITIDDEDLKKYNIQCETHNCPRMRNILSISYEDD